MKYTIIITKNPPANLVRIWYQNNKRHRLDGPAMEWEHGKFWLQNDKLHRLDGPAAEYNNGGKYWYIEGKECTKEQFYEIYSNNNQKHTS